MIASKSHWALPRELRKRIQPLLHQAHASRLALYLVGGCVRDLLLGHIPLDIDVVVEGETGHLTKTLSRAYKAKLVTHPQFLTSTLQFSNGHHLDIATARRERYAEPAALPTVEPASLQEDLYRRDFSINAMALSLNADDLGHLWDPYQGWDDLNRKQIRVLHSDSFRDDPTRIFRAARFAGRLGYTVEWRTREWITECVTQQIPSRLSGARLREELIPVLMEQDPRPALRLLCEWGALSYLIPNLKWEKSHEVFFGHILKMKPKDDPLLLRLLVLLHALPFPKAVGCLGHLMFPQKTIEQIEQALLLLVRLRQGTLMVGTVGSSRPKSLSPEAQTFLKEAMRIKTVFPKKRPLAEWRHFQDSTPRLTGRDIRNLGYKPGPIFTRILDALRQARWEGKLRTREEEIRFVTQVFPKNGNS